VAGAYHEGIQTVLTDAAGILAAEVNQVWARWVREILIVDPVTLLVLSVILVVEVVDEIVKCLHREIIHIYLRHVLNSSVSHYSK
jgi:hypothetical protein